MTTTNRQNRYEHKKRADVVRDSRDSEASGKKRRKKKRPKSSERLNAERGRFKFDTINGFKLIDVE